MRWEERLIEILEEELACIRQMRALLAEEREAIVASDTSRILSLAKRKETLAMRQKLLEEARTSCLRRVGREGWTLSRLREELASPFRERVEELQAHLQEEVEALAWENKRNLLLINKAMELNRDLLKIFSDMVGLSYDANGSVSSDYNGGSMEIRG